VDDNLAFAAAQNGEQPGRGFILDNYLRYWPLFAGSLLLASAIGLAYLVYTPPLYSVSSSVLIKDRRDNPAQPRAEQFNYADDVSQAKNIDNEAIMLKSVSLMQRVLTELDLNTTYYTKNRLRTQEIDQSVLPFKVVTEHLDSAAYGKSWLVTLNNGYFELAAPGQSAEIHHFNKIITTKYGTFSLVSRPLSGRAPTTQTFTIKFEEPLKNAINYSRKLSVTAVNKQASVLSLSLVDAVPEKGKSIINKLVEVYNKEGIEDKNAIAINTINFIDTRLRYLGTELTDVEKGVETFKRQHEVADIGSQINQSLEDASSYNKQVADYGIQLDVLESIRQYITAAANKQQLIPSTLSVQDPTLSGLIAKYNELKLEQTRILRNNQFSNPLVEGITEQLATLRTNILATIGVVKGNLLATRRGLQAKSSQSNSRIQRVPTIERGLQKINREQELKRSLYIYLLQKREEAALSLAATVSSARVIDSAMASDAPVSPQKPAVLLLSLLLGVGIPFGLVYLRGLTDSKVQVLQEVSQAISAPILGELIHTKSKDSVVITRDSQQPIAEIFRLIRTNLQFATGQQAAKVLLVTSSMSGEGKTFFSLNLGASLVLAGKSVVMLSLDLRKQEAVAGAAPARRPGIADYLLSDSLSMDELVYESAEVPGLYRISTGALPANPAEVLLSPRMAKVLDVLKQSFDYLILDSSPVGQVADAFALAPYVDYTIYLVRYNFTHKAQLKIISKILSDKQLSPLALVLNDAKKSNLQSYSYGKGYGYQAQAAKRKLG